MNHEAGVAAGRDAAALDEMLAGIAAASDRVREQARSVLDGKTKPRGSLGFLEDVAAQYAAVRGEIAPASPRFAVVVAAADHGVSAHGVSAYPAEVTAQMVANIASGGAAVAVLSRQADVRLVVVDAGSRADTVPPGVLDRRQLRGSGDITVGAAMPQGEAVRLLLAGSALADELAADGITAVALGEMGIGNSTAAAALTAALLSVPAAEVTGPGTGVTGAAHARKVNAVEAALQRWRATADDSPLAVLAELGGLEIAFLTGLTLGAAAARMPVVLDGFIATSAALTAWALAPAVVDALIAGHRSPEPGHTIALRAMGRRPILELDLRLGEGSGAVLASSVVGAAVAVLTEMASFDSAGVTDTGV
jgi:nicotinate-nucleotide--dimethylbenzimidazole phosphoribosyltransferase